MQAYAKSDIGRIRETNEDSFVCQPPLLVVADGMGGHVAGEIASQMAVETLRSQPFAAEEADGLAILLEQAIHQANTQIYRLAREKSEYAGMGTTVTAAYVREGSLYWSHVGDSRLYLLRGGELVQITEDHSLVAELVRNGSITEEESHTHPHRNILLRAVGTSDQVKVESGVVEIAENDTFMLCSDGLTNMLDDETIRTIMMHSAPQEMAERLVEQANDAGGMDNITVVVYAQGDC